MDVVASKLIYLALILNIIPATPLPQIGLNKYPINNQTKNSNGSIEELVQRQTDTIKRIIIDQNQQQTRFEYPVITKERIEDKQQKEQQEKVEIDKLSLEELKIRCQHLAKIASISSSVNKTDQIGSTTPQTRPEYKGRFGTRRPINGFYVTTEVSTTKSPSPPPSSRPSLGVKVKPQLPTTQQPLPTPIQNVKYIKLEPVILQKTILSDGRIIYYWHRTLPSTVLYQQDAQLDQSYPASSTTSTTTTTTPSSNYNFRNFFPSFYSLGGSESVDATSTEKTTTSTTSSSTEKVDDFLYAQQLRFVVPVPYPNLDNVGVKRPWDFDQFAYYPKQLQPETVNVQMPYVPTFQVIKALAVPNKHGAELPKEVPSGAIDNVNV